MVLELSKKPHLQRLPLSHLPGSSLENPPSQHLFSFDLTQSLLSRKKAYPQGVTAIPEALLYRYLLFKIFVQEH